MRSPRPAVDRRFDVDLCGRLIEPDAQRRDLRLHAVALDPERVLTLAQRRAGHVERAGRARQHALVLAAREMELERSACTTCLHMDVGDPALVVEPIVAAIGGDLEPRRIGRQWSRAGIASHDDVSLRYCVTARTVRAAT